MLAEPKYSELLVSKSVTRLDTAAVTVTFSVSCCLCRIRLYNILPSLPLSSRWSFSRWFSYQKSVWTWL